MGETHRFMPSGLKSYENNQQKVSKMTDDSEKKATPSVLKMALKNKNLLHCIVLLYSSNSIVESKICYKSKVGKHAFEDNTRFIVSKYIKHSVHNSTNYHPKHENILPRVKE